MISVKKSVGSDIFPQPGVRTAPSEVGPLSSRLHYALLASGGLRGALAGLLASSCQHLAGCWKAATVVSYFHQQEPIGSTASSPASNKMTESKCYLRAALPLPSTTTPSLCTPSLPKMSIISWITNFYPRYQKPVTWGKYYLSSTFPPACFCCSLLWRGSQPRGWLRPGDLQVCPQGRRCPRFHKQTSWRLACVCSHPNLLRSLLFSQEKRDQPQLSTLGKLSLKDRLLCWIIENIIFLTASLIMPKCSCFGFPERLLWPSISMVCAPVLCSHQIALTSPNQNKPFLFLATRQALWLSRSYCMDKHSGPEPPWHKKPFGTLLVMPESPSVIAYVPYAHFKVFLQCHGHVK